MMERASAKLGIALKVRSEKKRKSIERQIHEQFLVPFLETGVLYFMLCNHRKCHI